VRIKAGLIVGVVAGVALARSSRGKKFIDEALEGVSALWKRTDVQRRVSTVQDKIRENVPVVGDGLADSIDEIKPRQNSAE